jgi:hypothetical protein
LSIARQRVGDANYQTCRGAGTKNSSSLPRLEVFSPQPFVAPEGSGVEAPFLNHGPIAWLI